MPHLTILYSKDVEQDLDLANLCEVLREVMKKICADDGSRIFPTGGIRVLAFVANYAAIADGNPNLNYGFLYANLRMGKGRTQTVIEEIGKSLAKALDQHTKDLRKLRPVGVTLQIDVNGEQVFDVKFSSLHPLFKNN